MLEEWLLISLTGTIRQKNNVKMWWRNSESVYLEICLWSGLFFVLIYNSGQGFCKIFSCMGLHFCTVDPGVYKDVVYLGWPIAPSYTSPNADGGGSCGVSANEYSCVHHVTWSPNKLWRSNSIFNLWVDLSPFTLTAIAQRIKSSPLVAGHSNPRPKSAKG